jgi:peptide/nickel transport system substrate-binding protein
VSDRNGSLRIAATVVISTSLVAGCSSLPGDDAEQQRREIVTGTTSAPSTLDPAAAWDGSWELYKNTFQTLLSFPSSSSSPEPDAAERCRFTDNASRVYRCTLKKGLKFSNGNPLDAEAVKHSVERVGAIKSKSGPLGLMGSLDRVETLGKSTVVFHLKKPDATFPFILATPATAIVDPETYPAKKLLEGDKLVGSGPYTLESYSKGKSAKLEKYAGYKGPAKVKNDVVTVNYYKESSQMVKALKSKKIDVAYRGLTPDQVTGFQKDKANGKTDIELNEILGSEISYLVFNPQDPTAGKAPVRKAIAELIDRKALVRNVYKRTADPLYSMVPGGITGHTSAFYDAYGEPSKAEAERTLREAGINKKVRLTLWYTTDRYGDTTGDTFAEIKRQLNESGLFDITVKGRPWSEFVEGYSKGKYPAFGRGWFPDFPDADNYVAPFVGENNALGTPYENREITEDLLPTSRKESNRATASRAFTSAQKIIAKDARLLPLWQGRVYVASAKEVSGVEWVLDPSTLPRLWELQKKSSW